MSGTGTFKHVIIALGIICILLFCPTGTFAAKPAFEMILQKYCVSCHGPKESKGDLRLDQLSLDFKSGIDGQVWAEVVEKINAGEMPPEDEAQPTADEIGKIIVDLDDRIREGREESCTSTQTAGPSSRCLVMNT